MARPLPILLVVLWAIAFPCRALADEDTTGTHAAMDRAMTMMDAAAVALAQDSALVKKDWAAVGDDTLAVRTAAFDTSAINLLQTDPAYDYDKDLHIHTLWWARLKGLLEHWLQKIFGSRAGSWVFGHLDWAILSFAILFLLFYFRKRIFFSVFAPEAGRPRQVTAIEENIEALDLDKLLAKAEKAQDWRIALRYHYLKVLRRLMDEGLIQWQPRYTDHDYMRQLKDPAKRAAFGEVSFLFKWAWYGDAPMDEARYRTMLPAFVSFHAPNGNER